MNFSIKETVGRKTKDDWWWHSMSTAELILGHASYFYEEFGEEDRMLIGLIDMRNEKDIGDLVLSDYERRQVGRLLISLEKTLAAFERGEDDEDVYAEAMALPNIIPPTRELIALLRKWGYSEEDADLDRHSG
jgi:hypothetical protein